MGGSGTMMDRQISAMCVLCWSLWAASFGLWGVAWITSSPDLSNLALILCGAAVTATVKSFFISQTAKIKTAIAVTSTVVVPTPVRPLR